MLRLTVRRAGLPMPPSRDQATNDRQFSDDGGQIHSPGDECTSARSRTVARARRPWLPRLDGALARDGLNERIKGDRHRVRVDPEHGVDRQLEGPIAGTLQL